MYTLAGTHSEYPEGAGSGDVPVREKAGCNQTIVSVIIADMSDGEGWTDMETTKTKMARKKTWSAGGREGESNLRQSVKNKKTNQWEQ